MQPDDPDSVARTKRARLVQKQSINSQPPSDSKQAQPDLVPRMTTKERHGQQVLRESMQEMTAMNDRSEQAADRRFTELQV